MPQVICIRIAGTVFSFQRAEGFSVSERTAEFLVDPPCGGWTCSFEPAETLEISGKCIYREPLLETYEAPKGRMLRKYLDPADGGSEVAVACGDAASKTVRVKCSEKTYDRFFNTVEHCMDFIGIEWALMQEHKLFLHASCIDTAFGGILFTGPCGIGKSTQADLWCEHRNAELINGDKTLLVKEQGVWYGWGSTYAGSSNCFRNQRVKIRAIVVLKQAESCSLRRLEQNAAFRAMYSQLTVNSWNREFMEFAVDFGAAVAEELPFYELACTPTRDAVELLWNALQAEGNGNG